MSDIHCPHDKLFKSAMADIRVARDFFRNYLPKAIFDLIDFESLKLWPNSYVDQSLKLSNSDVLYEVLIAGQTAFLYLLCEHQSYIDYLMPLRLWQYIIHIWQDYLKKINGDKNKKGTRLPLVIPIVFYHGTQVYDGPRNIADIIQAPTELIKKFLLEPFHLIDTHDISDETLKTQPWAGVLAFTFKHIFDKDILPILPMLVEMMKKIEPEGATDYIVLVLNYLMATGETKKPDDFVKIIEKGFSSEIRGKTMSIAQKLIEKGVLTGESNILIHLIQHKFGVITPYYREKIQNASNEELLLLAEKVLEVDDIETLFDN